ncbi:hypothetical protein [Thiocapsa sp. UBA6158]|jgi:hypothetical protein|uniref:hypothetical protein n=1 Tax=Thiocapsa sp. UBA6158 TaxID=1947692 RepID=UPI0025DE6E52|nr:hypothetical protein [Thiocapsa sp. UBA6158]
MEAVSGDSGDRRARENAVGFSGLSSLVSKVDTSAIVEVSNPPRSDHVAEVGTLEPQRPISPGPRSTVATTTVPRTTSQPAPKNTERAGTTTDKAKGQKPPSVLKGVLWLIGVFVIFVMLADLIDNSQSENAGTRTSTPSNTAPTAATQSVPSLEFKFPPIGTGHHLNVSEIRWCLREDIWIEAQRPLATTNSEIDRFNAMVDDYNRRCGSYRYYDDAFNRAKRDVESLRSAIVTKARSEPTGSSTSPWEPHNASSAISPSSVASERRNVTLRGWTSDRNAAQVGPSGSYSEDGIGVNFPLDGSTARLVACTSNYDSHGLGSMQFEIKVDDNLVQSGIGEAITGSDNCWNLALSTQALRGIKAGRLMMVRLSNAVTFRVDLTGSAKALNTAWDYVEQRLSR